MHRCVHSCMHVGIHLPSIHSCAALHAVQIPPTMRDEEVLRAFNQCGEVVGHKFMRHTNCAFVDFATQAGATEARKKLDGARVGAAQLRVEYKNEKQWWAGQGARAAAAAGSGPGAREAAPLLRADTGPLRDRCAGGRMPLSCLCCVER